ncbi:unnamed protein product [Meganyctiphanes norvegica]|uniref:Uncharacterized protein n=1 Tax=Meganyctiphanes norvegica TaxID=48144 RepID=A0AAV2QH24_MEGNR
MKQSTLNGFIIKAAAADVPRNEVQCDQIAAKPFSNQTRPSAKRKAHGNPDTSKAYYLKGAVFSSLIGSTSMSWLRYDQLKGMMICYVCREFLHLLPSIYITMITGYFPET